MKNVDLKGAMAWFCYEVLEVILQNNCSYVKLRIIGGDP